MELQHLTTDATLPTTLYGSAVTLLPADALAVAPAHRQRIRRHASALTCGAIAALCLAAVAITARTAPAPLGAAPPPTQPALRLYTSNRSPDIERAGRDQVLALI